MSVIYRPLCHTYDKWEDDVLNYIKSWHANKKNN